MLAQLLKEEVGRWHERRAAQRAVQKGMACDAGRICIDHLRGLFGGRSPLTWREQACLGRF
eukprot:2725529-Lingulodinium_polyedra.AAC.1